MLFQSISSEDASMDTARVNKFLQGTGGNKTRGNQGGQPWWDEDDDSEQIGEAFQTMCSLHQKKVQICK